MSTSNHRRPCDYERHALGDNRRFHVRQFGSEYQVYGVGLDHVAMCQTIDIANMVASSLEAVANIHDARSDQPPQQPHEHDGGQQVTISAEG